MEFTLHHTDTQTHARLGTLKTAHGEIQTPIFMPVGTAATVKAVHIRELKEDINAEISRLPLLFYVFPLTKTLDNHHYLSKLVCPNR